MTSSVSTDSKALIVFDLGGTVFDKSYKIFVAYHILREFGLSLLNPFKLYRVIIHINEAKKEAKKLVGVTWDLQFAQKYAQDILQCSPEEFLQKMVRIIQKTARPFPEMMNIIQRLREQNYSLAILSNTDHSVARAIRESVFAKDFDLIVLSSEENIKKPDSAAFDNFLKKVQRTAQECLYFDNNRKNVKEAQKIGFQAYHFQSPAQVRQVLSQHNIELRAEDNSAIEFRKRPLKIISLLGLCSVISIIVLNQLFSFGVLPSL